jgi:hypothetical protein
MREQCEPFGRLVIVDHMRPLQVEENGARERNAEHGCNDPIN